MAEFNDFKGENEKYTVEDFYRIIKSLRAPDGCPWDRVQTHETLIKPMIEEAYEAVEAIKKNDRDNMVEEFGDVFLQVMLNSVIGEEEGQFKFEDVVDRVCRKMVFRHSHVFGDAVANSAWEALDNWEKMKKIEHSGQTLENALDDIPKSFPSLLRATKVAKKFRTFEESFDGLEADTENMTEKQAENYNVGEKIFKIIKDAEALGINGEEAMTFYLDELINKYKNK